MNKGKGSKIQNIAKIISKSQSFVDLRAEFLRNLRYCSIIDSKHNYSKYTDGAISDVFISWGSPPGRVMARIDPIRENHVYMDFTLNKLIDVYRLIQIINNNRGHDKTCKTESIKEELMDCTKAYFINFSEFDAIRQSVKQKIIDYSVSREFMESKAKAYEDYAVEEIKNVLMKFRGVGETGFRRAFKEFVLEDIMTG